MNEKTGTRIGVVGCGAIAELYHLPALEKNSQTVGRTVLADPSAARLEHMRQKFSVSDAVADYRDLLGRVDGVIVATPPTSHFSICKWFLENGVHVLCEKPLTETLTEAGQLVQLANRKNVKLAVNQTRRFFPTYQKIRELIEAGALGELQSITYHDGVEFSWPAASPHHFSPGAKGAWSDTGVHLLDTICYWLDAKPELMESLNDSHAGPEALATVRLRHQQCDIEIKVSRLGRLRNSFEIVGSKGSIVAGAEDWAEIRVQMKDGSVQRHKCGSRRLQYNDFAEPLLANFVSVIQDQAEPTVSAASTLPAIELLEQAYDESQAYPMPWNRRMGKLRPAGQKQLRIGGGLGRVLVTGAAGFVGARVVEAMHLSDFAVPIAAIRSWSRAARVARFPVEIQICDILDPEQVDAAVRGVDAIVHCAKTDDRSSIVGGTRNLLEAAERHAVGQFVFLSTAEVYGPEARGVIQETASTKPTGRLYGDAKIEAEEVCREFNQRGVATTILRPSIIYGPFSTSWSIDIAKRLQSGNWGKFQDQGEGTANLVHVDDLMQAIFRSLVVDTARGQAFNVGGPEKLTWNQYFEAFNTALGLEDLKEISVAKSRLRTRVRDWADFVAGKILDRYEDKLMEIYLRGGIASRVMKRIKGEINSTPSGGELNDLFARRVVYSDDKARTLIGYAPQIGIEQGLRLTCQWLALHEIAKRSPNETKKQSSDASQEAFDEELIS